MPETSGSSAPGDAALVAWALAGDTTAFGVLVERHWALAVAIAAARVRDIPAAEDVAQEGFVRAYRHLRNLRDHTRFAGWLSRIVVQESAEYLRRHKRNGSVSIHGIAEAQEPLCPDAAESVRLSEQQCRCVREAVGRLPDKLQRVILMRFVADLSAPQIAEQLGQRPGTIRIWLHRAYQRLRQQVAPIVEEVNER